MPFPALCVHSSHPFATRRDELSRVSSLQTTSSFSFIALPTFLVQYSNQNIPHTLHATETEVETSRETYTLHIHATMRNQPNIIITGTPGVGKTTHCEVLASNAGLKHVAVNDVVKNEECYEGFDDELGSWIVDEDKLLDILELELEKGGIILDWHACDLFPERLIDLVVVLRTDSSILYDRLEKRGYGEKKLEENLDAEIMEVLLEEARDAYDEHIVVELRSEEVGDMEENCDRLEEWVGNWRGKQAEMRRERGRVDGTMDDEDGSIQEENEGEDDDGTEKEDGDAMDDGEES